MKQAIVVPNFAMPKKDLENPCPCQDEPVKITYKKGILLWLKNVGDFVHEDEVVCEGEVEKKAVEFLAPCDGYLSEQCIHNGMEFAYGDVLGYIDVVVYE